MQRLAMVLISIATLAACGDGDDGPTPDDGAVRSDGGVTDATAEAGTGTDAGDGLDAGEADAGTPDDAAIDDAATDAEAADGAVDGGPVSMPCMAAGECDPFDVAACPDAESCRPATTGGTRCQSIVDPPAAEDEACASPADCGPGLLCLDFGAGFTCQRMCPEGSIGFCGDGKGCIGTIGHPCIQICRPVPEPCDIYAQDCVDPDDTCTFTRNRETGEPYTGCRPAGTQGHGDPCGGDDGTCGHSLVCVRVSGSTTCHYVCGPGGGEPMCTVAGEECTGFATTWMVSFCQ